jgi:soluble P-type ATPase
VLIWDTFGRARKEPEGVDCAINVLEGEGHVSQKENYVIDLDAGKVDALGNGTNDVLMLKAARLGIAACLREGCSRKSLEAAMIFVTSPINAIHLRYNFSMNIKEKTCYDVFLWRSVYLPGFSCMDAS